MKTQIKAAFFYTSRVLISLLGKMKDRIILADARENLRRQLCKDLLSLLLVLLVFQPTVYRLPGEIPDPRPHFFMPHAFFYYKGETE